MTPIADISEVLLKLGLSSSCTEEERGIVQEALRAANAAVIRHLHYDPVYGTRVEFYPQSDLRRGDRTELWEVSDTKAYVRQLAEFVSDELQLVNIPLRSIVSLKIDYDGRFGKRAGSFGASTAQTEGVDFWAVWDSFDSSDNPFCADGVIRSEGRWPDVPGSVRVEYISGYTIDELHGQDTKINALPILDAVMDETVRRVFKDYSRRKRGAAGFAGPFTSENLGDYSYTVDSAIYARLVGGTGDLLPETIQKLSEFVKMDLGVL